MTKKAIEKYDNDRYGPILGVSDEGSAAQTIADAAYKSAKAQAADDPGPLVVGVIIDGERMGSAGEVPIGPPEYAQVLPAAKGRTFCTTNVGVRVNTRLHQPYPEFRIAEARQNEKAWLDAIFAKFEPFIHTPDSQPRPLTVRLRTETKQCHEDLRKLVPKLEAGRAAGRIGSPELHRLSVLLVFEDEIDTGKEIGEIKKLMRLAKEVGVPEVAIDGKLVDAARRRISIQGLLNVVDPDTARDLLAYGKQLGVRIAYHFEVDPETAARTVWTGLNSAQKYGLTAAKYGLFPLMLGQQEFVVTNVQEWMKDWTPIPAFYVDTPLVTDDDVYEVDRIVESCRMWMDMIVRCGAKVALIDCPDRIDPHKLLKRGGPKDPGLITLKEVAKLTAHAQKLGLKALWSGGISAPQAYELGKLGVAGLFTTGSTAHKVAVHGAVLRDGSLAAVAEPTDKGVRRIHGLAGAGFLYSKLGDAKLKEQIDAGAKTLIDANKLDDATEKSLRALDKVLIKAWKKHWAA